MGLSSSFPAVIEKSFIEYYSSLFLRREHGSDSQLKDYLAGMPRLIDETKEWLEAPISVEEIARAIDDFPSKKFPGPYCQTLAFYKKYKDVISGHLHAVIIEVCDTNTIPPSFLITHTVLIPKVDDEQKLKYIKKLQANSPW